MQPRIITLSYRKVLDAQSGRSWDKLVLADTYAELRLQAQNVNPNQQYRTYAELVQHVPGAAQLSFLVSAAARGYVQQLGGWVPDVADNQGRLFLKFTQFQFEIINSDLLDASRHQVAVTFYAEPVIWHETIGAYLLISPCPAPTTGEIRTTLFQLQPYLAIHALHPASTSQPADHAR
ncbi:hypothetical protein [Hymenobacter yonginensis]|uniref:Uncharacterized protein n=1 Tax=Hymenobacter yonginensis TaxID=748197 RepID=A0ABY7PNP2_9BACT|nr:hypothetical protein [Hymenobacter yonginensis]WBO84876.1 hypothetical protein O9Z63_01220 [Hymenobacter yonginensis]